MQYNLKSETNIKQWNIYPGQGWSGSTVCFGSLRKSVALIKLIIVVVNCQTWMFSVLIVCWVKVCSNTLRALVQDYYCPQTLSISLSILSSCECLTDHHCSRKISHWPSLSSLFHQSLLKKTGSILLRVTGLSTSDSAWAWHGWSGSSRTISNRLFDGPSLVNVRAFFSGAAEDLAAASRCAQNCKGGVKAE